MVRIYFGKRVTWKTPVAQDQVYFGIEVHRIFLGVVLTLSPSPKEG